MDPQEHKAFPPLQTSKKIGGKEEKKQKQQKKTFQSNPYGQEPC